MRTRNIVVRLVFAIVIAVGLSGCSRPSTPAIERAIENELPGIVGPAESYSVDLEGVRGTSYVERVTAIGKRVHPRGSPVLDRVDVVLTNVSYNVSANRLERVGNAAATVVVRADDAAAFLDQNRNLQNVSVAFEPPDLARVQSQPSIPGLQLPPDAVVEITGTLVGSGAHVDYDIARVSAAGVEVPEPAVSILSDALNPLVDLSAMPIALRVTGVHVEGSTAVIQVAGQYPPPTTGGG